MVGSLVKRLLLALALLLAATQLLGQHVTVYWPKPNCHVFARRNDDILGIRGTFGWPAITYDLAGAVGAIALTEGLKFVHAPNLIVEGSQPAIQFGPHLEGLVSGSSHDSIDAPHWVAEAVQRAGLSMYTTWHWADTTQDFGFDKLHLHYKRDAAVNYAVAVLGTICWDK